MQTVNAQPSRPTTIALLLAAGLLVALVAVVFAFAPGVEAHPCDPSSTLDKHVDPMGVPCSSTDPVHNTDAHARIWLEPAEGPRGAEFAFRGRGFPRGTVTVFEGDDENVDDREILGTYNVTTDAGTFFVRNLRVRGEPSELSYEVWVIDSEGETESLTFEINEETVTFEPHTAVIGSTLKITVADWQTENMSEGVAAVRIGGKEAYAKVTEYTNCYEITETKYANSDKVVSIDVNVPEGTLPGMQTVQLYTEDQVVVTGTGKSECTPGQSPGQLVTNSDARVEPIANQTRVIQKTIEIFSELPPVAPPAQKIITVDGGRDRELELKAYPPGDIDIHLDASDQIEISLPEFDLSGASFKSTGESGVIKISGNVIPPNQIGADDSGGKLTITLPSAVSISAEAGESLDITITEGTGILTPEIPRGFDDPDDGYPVAITFVDKGQQDTRTEAANNNIVVVKNPISSTVPNATVRVELVAHAEADIGSSEEIVVDFSGPSADSEFSVPASISNTRVTIRPQNRSAFNPSEILVQGAKVTLTVPSGSSPRSIPKGEYTITFSNLARIRNPFTAGIRDIKVSSFVQGDLEDVIKAVIRRTTTIDPLEGPRGTEFELEGKGYARGTVTVYHDADNDGQIDAGETLDSVNTVRGAFEVDLVARGEPGDLVYRVRTRDSEGEGDERVFRIRSGMFFNPPAARVGWPLQITISDWQDLDQEVAAVSVAGGKRLRREGKGVRELLRVYRPVLGEHRRRNYPENRSSPSCSRR